MVLGTEVRTVDGPIGVIDEVRTDPLSDRVTDILVRKGSGLKRDALIPVEFVSAMEPDHIQLSMTTEEVEALPIPLNARYIPVCGDEEQGKQASG
jgi:hypothetical protein